MNDVFQTIPSNTVTSLESKLNDLFACQETLAYCEAVLAITSTDSTSLTKKATTTTLAGIVTNQLEIVEIKPSDLISDFKSIDESTILQYVLYPVWKQLFGGESQYPTLAKNYFGIRHAKV